MAETPLKQPLKAILETIRERADYALKQLQDADEQRPNGCSNADCARGILGTGTIFRAGIATPKLGLRRWTTSCVGAVSVRREERSC